MEIVELLTADRQTIVDAAAAALARTHVSHYEHAAPGEVRRRLDVLFDQLLEALGTRNLVNVVTYAQRIAQERFDAGYDLAEVQTAFNALEEATWSDIFKKLEPTQFAEALGLVSTVLGAAKDALARAYVSLATDSHTPSLDLQALFEGTDG